MSCREIKEKYRTKQSKKKNKQKKQKKLDILSYYPGQLEKKNCLGETELATGKMLKSCGIIFEVVFLVEWVKCTINGWIIDHSYFHKLANAS